MGVHPWEIERFLKADDLQKSIARKLCAHLQLDETDIHPGYFENRFRAATPPLKNENKNWFTCTHQEWAFSQAFTNLKGMSKAKEQHRETARLWLFIALLPFAFLIAGELIHENFALGVYGVILYVIYRFIRSLKKNWSERKQIVRQMKGHEINYIKLDEQGIKINEKNDDRPDALTLIPWEHIGQIDFCYTQFWGKRRYLKDKLSEHADWITDLILDYRVFSETALSLFFYHEPTSSPQRSLHQFQIPTSWLMNGEFARLVSEIHQRTGVLIKPFDYHRSNIGIVRNDRIAFESQAKLDQIYDECLAGTYTPHQ